MGWTDVGVDRTVRLTYVVAALSVVVGVLNASVDFGGLGPVGALLSQSDRTVLNYTGALSGLALAVSTVAMQRGFRLGWLATVVFLLGTTIQGFFQARVLSLPLTVLSLLSLLLVVRNRRRFHRRFELTAAQRVAGGILLASQLYITVGSYSLRAQFGGIDSLGDAFYFAVVTSATVGYGDIIPTTSFARFFAVSAIFVGAGSFAGALGALLQPSLENLFRRSQGRMIESQFQTLEDHVLVLGHGELTESILEGFHDEPSVLVVTDDETVDEQFTAGGVTVYRADPTDDDVLRTARIGTARAVIVASQQDGPGALAILTARQLNPDVRIVAAATHRENVAKMKRAGADVVISPTNLGGRLLTASALGEVDAEALEQQLLGDDVEE
jgi:voltage-gated potassium channel